MSSKILVAPKITVDAHSWYQQTWENTNQGVLYILEGFPKLYFRGLFELRGIFTPAELKLIIDSLSKTVLTSQQISRNIISDCEDSIKSKGYDDKWKVNAAAFLAKLRSRSNFQLAILEIWATAFWRTENADLAKWIAGLTGDAPQKTI